MQFVQEEGASGRRRLRHRPRLGLRIKEWRMIFTCVYLSQSLSLTDQLDMKPSKSRNIYS